MSERVVIIGAGGSGRGFLARLLQSDGAQICFLDKNPELIQALREEGKYGIKVGNNLFKTIISNYEAFGIESQEAVERAAASDWIFTSIGEEHLIELVPFLEKAAEKRKAPLRIITCENGISPKKVLQRALAGSPAENSIVTQGVIFCTSIPESEKNLDIVSEDYQELPYDVDENSLSLPFAHFPATKNFGKLLQRKIYTYNCLSACIAYLGSYLKYEVYADAATDLQIRRYCEQLMVGLNRAICKSMSITQKEQSEFSKRAMRKFSNPDISDTIYKNARSAVRKLSPTERIMGPMKLMEELNEDISVLQLIVAAALLYLEEHEEVKYQGKEYSDVICLFRDLNPQEKQENLSQIFYMLEKLRTGENLNNVCPVKFIGKAVNY